MKISITLKAGTKIILIYKLISMLGSPIKYHVNITSRMLNHHLINCLQRMGFSVNNKFHRKTRIADAFRHWSVNKRFRPILKLPSHTNEFLQIHFFGLTFALWIDFAFLIIIFRNIQTTKLLLCAYLSTHNLIKPSIIGFSAQRHKNRC